MLTGLAPLVSSRTRVLILGSFPGVASLAAQQYYGHPQNHFWKILQAIWPSSPIPSGADSYQNRSKWLLDRQLGVWDVYASCEREGSLDSRIRHPVVNDFAAMLVQCPALEAIAHNGGESFKHAPHVRAALEKLPAAVRRAGPPQASTAPLGGSALHEVKSVGAQAFCAGPPQASTAPLGGSALHEVKSVGAQAFCAGPPQASTAPFRGEGGSVTPKAHEVKSVGVDFYKLPSTSPANASWSFERKLAAWREVFECHGLLKDKAGADRA